jgi:hypothetical protein
LAVAFALIAGFFVVELVAGLLAQSLAGVPQLMGTRAAESGG